MAERTDAEHRVILEAPAGSDAARRGRRQRRPSGAPPPLPHKLGMSGRLWLTLLALAFAGTILFLTFPTTLRIVDRIDAWLLKGLAHIRTPWLTSTMRGIASAGSGWTITVLGLGTVAALMVFRRWRHVLLFLGAAFLMALIGRGTYLLLTRPRPYDVRIIGWWSGFSMASPPVTVLATI